MDSVIAAFKIGLCLLLLVFLLLLLLRYLLSCSFEQFIKLGRCRGMEYWSSYSTVNIQISNSPWSQHFSVLFYPFSGSYLDMVLRLNFYCVCVCVSEREREREREREWPGHILQRPNCIRQLFFEVSILFFAASPVFLQPTIKYQNQVVLFWWLFLISILDKDILYL